MLSTSSFFNKKLSSGPQIWLAELWFESNCTKTFNYLYHLSLVCDCMFHTDCLWISIVNFTVNILDSTVLFLQVSPVASLMLWKNSCFNLVLKSDLLMFAYMHKPMAFFRMVGSECHFFRSLSFSDETISSLTLRWSRSKQEGRHSPAHRRWRALAAKVIQPSPSIRANQAISKREICNIVSNVTPRVQFVQGSLARLGWAQWVHRLSGQHPCRGCAHCQLMSDFFWHG